MALVHLFQTSFERLSCPSLQFGIDGGLDLKPEAGDFVGAKLGFQLSADGIDRLGREAGRGRTLGDDSDGGCGDFLGDVFVDVLKLGHLPEHVDLPLLGGVGVLVGGQPLGRLHQPSQ